MAMAMLIGTSGDLVLNLQVLCAFIYIIRGPKLVEEKSIHVCPSKKMIKGD